MIFRNAIHSAFTVSTLLAPALATIFKNTGVLIDYLPWENCESKGWASFSCGQSSGAPFCAQQLRHRAVIDWLKFWATDTEIWAMDVHFTNNALMSVGNKSHTGVQETYLPLRPGNTSIVKVESNQFSGDYSDQLLKGFRIAVSGARGTARNETTTFTVGKFDEHRGATFGTFPDFPRTVLAGIRAKTGTYGIEMLVFHFNTLVSTAEVLVPEDVLKEKE